MQVYRGIVQHGQGEGRRLGFPTANLPLPDKMLYGICAARVVYAGTTYDAAAYINSEREILEVHLLDFDGDLYDKELEVTIIKEIRGAKKYTNEEELKNAIASDVRAIRTFFAEEFVN